MAIALLALIFIAIIALEYRVWSEKDVAELTAFSVLLLIGMVLSSDRP